MTQKKKVTFLYYGNLLLMLAVIAAGTLASKWNHTALWVLLGVFVSIFIITGLAMIVLSRCPHCQRWINLPGPSSACPKCGEWIPFNTEE